MTVRYRREQNAIDTAEKPDIKMWVDQTAIPVKDDSEWTLGTNMVASTGDLVLTASPDAEVAKRNIPGLLEGHAVRVTIVLDSIDAGELDLVIGGVTVASLDTPGTIVYDIRPTYGNEITITVDNSASVITATISSMTFAALDSINGVLLPSI
jgi:hypothetical protein